MEEIQGSSKTQYFVETFTKIRLENWKKNDFYFALKIISWKSISSTLHCFWYMVVKYLSYGANIAFYINKNYEQYIAIDWNFISEASTAKL